MKTRAIVFPLISCLAIYGCAGRTPNPVTAQQYGDERKSCSAIQKELTFVEGEIKRMLPDSDKTGQNVALGVAGVFLLVPWFFMDFSDADKVEINAYRRRYNHLVILADEKKCGFDYQPIPDFSKPPEGNVAAHEERPAPDAKNEDVVKASAAVAQEPKQQKIKRTSAESGSAFPANSYPNDRDNQESTWWHK